MEPIDRQTRETWATMTMTTSLMIILMMNISIMKVMIMTMIISMMIVINNYNYNDYYAHHVDDDDKIGGKWPPLEKTNQRHASPH